MGLLTLSLVAAQGVARDVPNPPDITDTDLETGEVIEIEAGNEQLTVTWTAPGSDGGSAITGYKVQWKSGDEDYDAATRQSPSEGNDALDGDARTYTIADNDLSNTAADPLTNGTAYTVQVIAVNAEGDSLPSDEATGTPEGVPDAPEATVTVSNMQLTVTWTAPNNRGSEITGYTVQWKSGNDDYDATARQSPSEGDDALDGDARTYTIADNDLSNTAADPLTNDTAYTVRVRATNGVGVGSWSAEEAGTPTAGLGAPPDAPGNVRIAAYHQELVVTWDASTTNGVVVTGYTVQWKSGNQGYDDTSRQADVAADTDPLSYTIDDADGTGSGTDGPTNGTAYTVRVRATSVADAADASNVNWAAEVGTPAGVPAAPTGVSAAAGYAQLTVMWTASLTNDREDVTSYTVQWKSGEQDYDASRQKIVTAPSEEDEIPTEYVITGLDNDPVTEYTVRVIATNAAGDGPAAEAMGTPAATTSAGDVPAAPTGVSAAAGYEQLTVSWTVSTPQNAVVTGYTVQWKSGTQSYNTGDRQAPVAADADPLEYTIMGLTNDTVYTVQVIATSAAGDSSASDEATGTPAATPAAPGNVQVAAYHQELVVTWDASTTDGAAVTNYTVQWKSGNQGYDTSRQADVADVAADTDPLSYTIDDADGTGSGTDGLTNGTAYTVRGTCHQRRRRC